MSEWLEVEGNVGDVFQEEYYGGDDYYQREDAIDDGIMDACEEAGIYLQEESYGGDDYYFQEDACCIYLDEDAFYDPDPGDIYVGWWYYASKCSSFPKRSSDTKPNARFTSCLVLLYISRTYMK